jgi:trehalose/maltose transport system substrate-binding protein
VVSYRETDTMLLFNSGRAAFGRMWILTPMSRKGQAQHIGWLSSLPVVKTGLSRLPGETEPSAGTLGGTGTAISLHSTHRQEAIELLRFQLRSLIDEGEKGGGFGVPFHVELSNPPSIPDPLQDSIQDSRVAPESSKQPASIIVARPSIETGIAYKAVSQAYSDAVHSVLVGQMSAPEAAAKLEQQLIQITGFRPGPPKTTDNDVQ